jgi:hypothetical protein
VSGSWRPARTTPEKEAELAARHDRIRAEVAADETSEVRRGRRLRELGSLLSILVLVAINWLWFDLVGSDYLEWFVDNGTLIALRAALRASRDRPPVWLRSRSVHARARSSSLAVVSRAADTTAA